MLLRQRRLREDPGLRFLTFMCLLQYLMNRHFIIENSGASEIYTKSPLAALRGLSLHSSRLDQCMYGAKLENQTLQKSSMFVSDVPLRDLDKSCDHTHTHLPLVGSGPNGSRTASAARYPVALCDAILVNINQMTTTPRDGGRKMPSYTFKEP